MMLFVGCGRGMRDAVCFLLLLFSVSLFSRRLSLGGAFAGLWLCACLLAALPKRAAAAAAAAAAASRRTERFVWEGLFRELKR